MHSCLSSPCGWCSVTQCPTLCNPMDWSTPASPVLHHLLEFAQTHVHWVGDANQTSHPLTRLSSWGWRGCLFLLPAQCSSTSSRWLLVWGGGLLVSPWGCLFVSFFFFNISFLLKKNYFIFGCGGSSLVLGLFCRCRGQGLLSSGVRWLLLWSTDSRACGLQKLRLPGSRVQAQ